MPDTPSIAIIIVSYNVRAELAACLRSLANAPDAGSTTIVVVDNASSDGTAQMVREEFPTVEVVEPGENLGFARANNLGIRRTASDLVLLLNPDTLVPPGALTTLAAALAAQPRAAAAGPRLVDGQGRAELSFGWALGPWGELRQKVIGGGYARRLRWMERRVEAWTRAPGRREWLSGACLLVRRADLEAVGLLDERYFMYTEDVDLCVRLRARGRTVIFVPDAEVVHLRGRSAGRNPHTERLRRASQLAYYAKHHPRWLPALRVYLRLTGKAPR